jgi:hypothetical protein
VPSTSVTADASAESEPTALGDSIAAGSAAPTGLRLGFEQGVDGWLFEEFGGTAPNQGSLRAGRAVLDEGNSFLVSLCGGHSGQALFFAFPAAIGGQRNKKQSLTPGFPVTPRGASPPRTSFVSPAPR